MSARDQRQVLAALFAALERPERGAEILDDASTVEVARRHRLTPLLAVRCRDTLPGRLGELCHHDRVLTTARNLALAAVAEECVTGLAAAGVEAALLKGLAYERTIYNQPGARPTSDVDLLVRERDRRAAFQTLDRLGFEPRAAAPGFDDPDYHEVAWQRGPAEVDLHLALAPYARCAIDYEAVWREAPRIALGAARPLVLAPSHAAVFHALHMAIDHFDVPALYLIDLARLVPSGTDAAAASALARTWRCHRPWTTSATLAAAFQHAWAGGRAIEPSPRRAKRVADRFGGVAALPRPAQLVRKFAHFDVPSDAVRYTYVQGRRLLHELVERRIRRRAPRARLGL